MTFPKSRRPPRLESLETRQLLSRGAPTADAQYMLELINEARTNPPAAAERAVSNLDANVRATVKYYNVDLNARKQAIAASAPKPPLAWNDALAGAAQAHSQDMADAGYQSHDGTDGTTPAKRMERAGYASASASAENAFAYATSADEAMKAFLLDWGVPDEGHRRNLQQPDAPADSAYRDVGIGLVKTGRAGVGPLVVTQNLASRAGAQAVLLGVVYRDDNGDRFYEPGEGQGSARVDATNLATGQTSTAETADPGGYQMSLAPGRYRVNASVGGQSVGTADLDVGTQNAKRDFVLDPRWSLTKAAVSSPVTAQVTADRVPGGPLGSASHRPDKTGWHLWKVGAA
jgi:uncharacterized protein YkwD